MQHNLVLSMVTLFTFGSASDNMAKQIVSYQYYPRYHMAPPYGWMNDPNGFSIFKNEYHLFYQFNPNSSLEPGIAHWGHAKSKDLLYWEHLPIALYPNNWYDKSGVFSGSVVVEKDTMYLFYTGNVKYPGEDPDYVQRQALAISQDGINFTKYENNPIIHERKGQPDIRDPKAWKHEDKYYMVLGNSYKNKTVGRAVLYTSDDMMTWSEVSVLDKSKELRDYMWECPDFFPLYSMHVLLFSPLGLKRQGDKYNILYRTGYTLGVFNYVTHKFFPLTKFRKLDHGHDFYATQTLLDENGRRIMIAWFDMWDQYYPERKDGWSGHMTLPRVLTLSLDGRLMQNPVEEIKKARDRELYNGKAKRGTVVALEDKAGEIIIQAPMWRNMELFIESDNENSTVSLKYDFRRGQVTLDRGGTDGVRQTKWLPWTELKWRIFIDASSIELFCGDGEVTFSSRFFPDGPVKIRLGDNSDLDLMQVYTMRRTIPKP